MNRKTLKYIISIISGVGSFSVCGGDGEQVETNNCERLESRACLCYGEESERCSDAKSSIIKVRDELSYDGSERACSEALNLFYCENESVEIAPECSAILDAICGCVGEGSLYCTQVTATIEKLTSAEGSGSAASCLVGASSYSCRKPNNCKDYAYAFCNCSEISDDGCAREVLRIEKEIDERGAAAMDDMCKEDLENFKKGYPQCAGS
ncbi:MAG: hypothetical protein Kow0090_03250 [Myxococcota bacterium]